MDYKALGQRLRQYRQQLGLTQTQLGEMIGVCASYIGHIERGNRILSIDTLMKLVQALNITPNDVLLVRPETARCLFPDDWKESECVNVTQLLLHALELVRTFK